MREPFKFRYVNELAGGFVILASVLLLAAVFLAGRSRGWFEGRFRLTAVFSTEEGSFGLKEGDEIRVRNTIAGRVEHVRPTEDGQLQTVFVIQNRFLPFIRRDSVARVKKKFGVAGDSFVEIEMGKGEPVKSWDRIECRKDEALMDTAQRLLRDFQDVGMPMLKEVQEILQRVRQIAVKIESGDGTAGMLLNDPEMARSVKSAAVGVQGVLADARETVQQTTRLVRGFQNHWLLRKYVPAERIPMAEAIEYQLTGDRQALVTRIQGDLVEARSSDRAEDIATAAETLSALCLASGDMDGARRYAAEAVFEAERARQDGVPAGLLEAEVLIRSGDVAGAQARLADLRRRFPKTSRTNRVRLGLMEAGAACAGSEFEAAIRKADGAVKRLDEDEDVELQGQAAWIRMQAQEGLGRCAEAAREADAAAAFLQQAGLFEGMASATVAAGRLYGAAGQTAEAGERLFRGGRTYAAQGNMDKARKALEDALASARQTGDNVLLSLVEAQINALPVGRQKQP